jgi:hypothetical protein
MEYSRDDAACPARDLMAQLLAELERRRATLRAAELQLAQLDDLVIDGTIDYPIELVQQVQACKREVAAITQVLADMLGFDDHHAIGA